MEQDDRIDEEKVNNETMSDYNQVKRDDPTITNGSSKKEKSLWLNSLFYLIYTTLNLIFPLITGIYVARVLLPSDIGQIETARNVSQYFLILSYLGIPAYGLREISKYRNDKKELNKIYTELRIINNISTLIFSSIYVFVIFVVPSYRENFEIFLIVGILVFLNLFNNAFLYEGLEEFKYISIRNLLFKLISFICLLVFVKDESDTLVYACILSLGTAGNYLLNIIHSRKYVKLTFKELNLKRHMKPIMFLVVVNLAIEIYSLVDVTMLGFMCDKETVAYYTYAIKIYRILLQVINVFTIVLVPRIALYFKENKINEMNKLVSKTFTIIFLLSLPMIFGIFFTADYLICLVYGDSYIRSAQVLKIVSIITLISPIGYLLGSRMLLISGHESKMIIAVGVGAIVNVIFNFILIYFYSEIGAAIASLISEIVVMAIYIFLGRSFFKLNNIIPSLIKIIIATLLMSAFCFLIYYFIKNDLVKTIIQVSGSILIYFSFLLISHEENTIAAFNKVFSKIRKYHV